MARHAPNTRLVRVQDLEPGMKVERINVDLDFVFVPVTRVVAQKVNGRTKSYRVYLDDGIPEDRPWLRNTMDSSLKPFVLRPTDKIAVLEGQA